MSKVTLTQEIIRDWEPDSFPKVVDTSGTRRRA